MINVEPCRGCGRILYLHPVANLTARLDAELLDADGAVTALIAGRTLWRIATTSVKGARPAELSALRTAEPGERPHIVQEHRCTPAGRPNTPPVPNGANPSPKGPERPAQSLADLSTRSSAPSTAPCGAHDAASRASDGSAVACRTCGAPITLDARDRLIQAALGATVIDVAHRTCPPATGVSGC